MVQRELNIRDEGKKVQGPLVSEEWRTMSDELEN
jgi:hypothetical protein